MTLFETITWKQYLSVVAIALVLYYAVIFFRYRRSSISRMLIKNKKNNQKDDGLFNPDNEEDEADAGQGNASHNIHSFDELERLVTEIRHSILDKAGKNISKEALLAQLSERLNNYGGLRQPAYRVALTNFIIEQSENICGVSFSEEELEEAWEKLPR